MKLIGLSIGLVLINMLLLAGDSTYLASIKLSKDSKGLGEMSWVNNKKNRNYIDSGFTLGNIYLKYKSGDSLRSLQIQNQESKVINNHSDKIKLLFQLPGLDVIEQFNKAGNNIMWSIDLINKSSDPIDILNFSFGLPIGKFDKNLPVAENLNRHTMINGNASFCYWIP